jgi:hypothetical protein
MEKTMTVGNPENFKVQIKTGRDEVDSRVPCDFTNLTLKKLFSWIDAQQISSALKSELKKSASRFPHQTLTKWQNNFESNLSKAQARLRKKKNLSNSVPEHLEEKKVDTLPKAQMRAAEFNDFDDHGEEDIYDNDSDHISTVEHDALEIVKETIEEVSINEEISTVEEVSITEDEKVSDVELIVETTVKSSNDFNVCKENDI